jgi:hypothetical protein
MSDPICYPPHAVKLNRRTYLSDLSDTERAELEAFRKEKAAPKVPKKRVFKNKRLRQLNPLEVWSLEFLHKFSPKDMRRGHHYKTIAGAAIDAGVEFNTKIEGPTLLENQFKMVDSAIMKMVLNRDHRPEFVGICSLGDGWFRFTEPSAVASAPKPPPEQSKQPGASYKVLSKTDKHPKYQDWKTARQIGRACGDRSPEAVGKFTGPYAAEMGRKLPDVTAGDLVQGLGGKTFYPKDQYGYLVYEDPTLKGVAILCLTEKGEEFWTNFWSPEIVHLLSTRIRDAAIVQEVAKSKVKTNNTVPVSAMPPGYMFTPDNAIPKPAPVTADDDILY